MRQSKFTETQIVSITKEADACHPVNEIWLTCGISSATYYKRRAKYGDLEASDIKRLKELDHENGRLKRMYANLSLENAALKDVIAKKALRPVERREVVTQLVTQGGLPVQRPCQAVGLSRGTYYRLVVNWAQRDGPVIEALAKAGHDETTLGILEIRGPAHRASLEPYVPVGVYCRLQLNLPRRAKKRLPVRPVHPMDVIPHPNVVWALDFIRDTL